MRVAVVGLGAVGTRVARHLVALPSVESVTVVHRSPEKVVRVSEGLGVKVTVLEGGPSDLPPDHDAVVLTAPAEVADAAKRALRLGSHVVSTCDEPEVVRQLLALDAQARQSGLMVAAGVALAPGLSCVLSRFAASKLDRVDEVHVASFGTAGPACARRHHAAMSTAALDWHDGRWRRQPGGTGRGLVWFPDPIGGTDCYRAGSAAPALLLEVFPDARRVTARVNATRRDRLTSWLPMLRAPHPEGRVGAVRVELRGAYAGRAETVVIAASGRPGMLAGATAAFAASWAASGVMARTGAGGLGRFVDEPGQFLRDLSEHGVATSVFEGKGPGHLGAGT